MLKELSSNLTININGDTWRKGKKKGSRSKKSKKYKSSKIKYIFHINEIIQKIQKNVVKYDTIHLKWGEEK